MERNNPKENLYCDKWCKNYPMIFDALELLDEDQGCPEGEMDIYVYCLWCGKELPCGDQPSSADTEQGENL